MKHHYQGHYYTSLPIGERITIAHYHLEDDMRLVPAPSHMIGVKVRPWDLGLWFKADKSPILYVQPNGSISNSPPPGLPESAMPFVRAAREILSRNPQPPSDDLSRTRRPVHGGFPEQIRKRLEEVAAMPKSHQAAAVTAASLADWGEIDPGFTPKAPNADKAMTYDDGKAPLAYLPWAGVDALAKVQLYGHKKYKDFYNYRKGMEVGRNASCAIRHIRDYMNGQDNDAESGENHLAHAACRLLFILQNLADGTAIDDRYSSRKKEAA